MHNKINLNPMTKAKLVHKRRKNTEKHSVSRNTIEGRLRLTLSRRLEQSRTAELTARLVSTRFGSSRMYVRLGSGVRAPNFCSDS